MTSATVLTTIQSRNLPAHLLEDLVEGVALPDTIIRRFRFRRAGFPRATRISPGTMPYRKGWESWGDE